MPWRAIVSVSLCFLWLCGGAAGAPAVDVRPFPIAGQVEGLEPEVLDLRYAPARGQACIGLPDDPHKSIVGSDGALYYHYGAGKHYGFGTRIEARPAGAAKAERTAQLLLDPRVPVVVTERRAGGMLFHQEVWAGAPEGARIEEWSPRRADYLWLRLTNAGVEEISEAIVVTIDAKDRLAADASRARLVHQDDPPKTFCAADPPWATIEEPPPTSIRIDRAPGVNRGWARPRGAASPVFRNVMVGWNGPLAFSYPAAAGKKYRAAFGLIEGWHAKGGARPLEIRAEGSAARSIDLVAEFGQNVPVVLSFDVADANGDGRIELAVHPRPGAEDQNTILSALWIFERDTAPSDDAIVRGDGNRLALALLDADAAAAGNQIRISFGAKTLAPGESFGALLVFPQGERASAAPRERDAERERDRAIEFWKKVDLPYDRIAVPDPAVQGLLDSCIRNIYQAREIKGGKPAFQVGPTCYRGTWAADGPFIMEAVTYLGRAAEVRAGLENQVDQDQGPGGVGFSKKCGLRLWMIRRHGQLTGDRDWLRSIWPKVVRDVEQIKAYRAMTRNDPAQVNFGLMPRGFGDGGLGGEHREYTNVYWTLAGFRAAIEMAEELGRADEAAAWKAEYGDYGKAFERARERDKLEDGKGNVYVPVTMKGEAPQLPQRGAWAFLQSIYPGRIFAAGDTLMLGTMAMLDANCREGLIHGTGWLADGIWNYAGSFYAHAHLWLGHGRKAAATLYAFGNHASPLLCWREEQNVRGEAYQDCGDMPHNWASGEFIRLVRHLLMLERGDELHLLEGIPVSWTKPGCATRLVEVPTSFGPVSLTLRVAGDGKAATLQIVPPRVEPGRFQQLARICVHTEHFARPAVEATREVGPDRIAIELRLQP